MRAFVALLLVAGILTSGCIVEAQEPVRAYNVVATLEPSMLPDFGTQSGPYYRFVQIHQHVMPSPAQQRYANDPNRPIVVCFRLDGVTPASFQLGESESASSSKVMMDSAAMAPCMPIIDAGRGRLFVNRTDFERMDPMAVAVLDPCSGGYMPIHADEPGFVSQAPAKAFRMEFLANDTLLVDRTWYVLPGQTLKVEYMAAGPREGADDDQPVKFVIDYPGYWLLENVGPLTPEEPVTPPRPMEGDGPQAWVPRAPVKLSDVLDPLLTASLDANERISMLRLTALNGRLTDLQAELMGSESIEWFVGGGNETHLHLLGTTGPSRANAGLGLVKFQGAFADFDLKKTLADSKQVIEIRWTPDVALKSKMPVAWSETWVPSVKECATGCSYVWASAPAGSASWRYVEDPTKVPSENALTLTISVTRDGTATLRELYHRP